MPIYYVKCILTIVYKKKHNQENPQYLCNPLGGLSPHVGIEALLVRVSAQNIWNMGVTTIYFGGDVSPNIGKIPICPPQ